jgi:hypothetical protein
LSFPIVVLTCVRPEQGEPFRFFNETIAQLEAERPGLDFEGHVVCDITRGDAPPTLPEGWELHKFHRPAGSLPGNKLPYWNALEIASHRAGDAALVFEDDVALCPNALRRMVSFPIPRDLDFVMFYAPAVFQNPRVFPGLWRTPTPVIGTQAIKFRKDALWKLVEFSRLAAFGAYTASDEMLEAARVMLGMKYGAHCPEIVQHVGEESAVDYGADLSHRWRRAHTFAASLDAMALYARDEYFR